MRTIILSILMAILSLPASACGQFTNHSNEVAGGYNFILYQPQSATTPLPLIITLHSRSSAGNDLANVDRFGTIDALHSAPRNQSHRKGL